MYCISLLFASYNFSPLTTPTTSGLQVRIFVLDSICFYLYTSYSHKPRSKLQTSFILLTRTMFKCPQHVSQTCTKTCIILRKKEGSSSFLPLQSCLLKFKVKTSEKKKWSQEKTSEANRMVKLDFAFQNCHFCAYIEKINTFIFWSMIIPLGPHSFYT